MQEKIAVLIPMSGQGTRYRKVGYDMPKPMIPVSGTPMISRLLRNFPAEWPIHCVLAENHRDTGLPELLKKERPAGFLSYVPVHAKGPGYAILEGLKAIPDDQPVLVSYCDFEMIWDASQFETFVRTSLCDACLVSYKGFHAHYLSPVKYAYSRMDGQRVVEVREKGSFTSDRESEYASCGAYYFKSAALLRKAIEHQIARDIQLNGEYYTSLTVQSLLDLAPDSDVRVFEIPYFFQYGTPEDLKNIEHWRRSFEGYVRCTGKALPGYSVSQILMPMAGLGSRFQAITPVIKPLIQVAGEPMYKAALRTMPKTKKTVLVGLKEFAPHLRDTLDETCEVRELEKTPPGQALSVEAGISRLNPGEDTIVTSCDHGIALDPELWSKFRSDPRCDAAIFTIQNYPGADRSQNSFAYVVIDEKESRLTPFPKIQKVSVKKPVSDHPSRDHLLVGTFWFKSPEVLARGIEELKKQDIRVNGELYLDSALQCLLDTGLTVRQIPLQGYICWGDPDSLAEALYWQEVFTGQRITLRPRFPGVRTLS